jgi:hypothetical protein
MKRPLVILWRAVLLVLVLSTLLSCKAVLRLFPNQLPIADAGPDQFNVPIGTKVYLDGSGSWDPDGDRLDYTWFPWAVPGASSTVLYNYKSVSSYFEVDATGTYVFLLIVDDGLQESKPDRVEISTP